MNSGNLLRSIDITEKKGTQSRLNVYEDHLDYENPSESQQFSIARGEAAKKVIFSESVLSPRVVAFHFEKKKTYRFPQEDYNFLWNWMGPMTRERVKTALRSRFKWILPIGILFMIFSAPLPADPSSGTAAVPFSPVSFGLGVTLILMSLVSRAMAHRVFFLADTLWFLALAGLLIKDVSGGGSALWLAFAALQVVCAWDGFQLFRRYSGTREIPGTAAE